jgi:uncharacterized secreted protein with C-terminal beta-propeller domain
MIKLFATPIDEVEVFTANGVKVRLSKGQYYEFRIQPPELATIDQEKGEVIVLREKEELIFVLPLFQSIFDLDRIKVRFEQDKEKFEKLN